MTDWFEGRLADACASIDYGLTASAALTPVGPKFLRITDIVGGSLDWDSVPFVETDEQSTQKYRLNHLDIVIARTGATTGVSRFISDPPTAVFASYLVRLSIKPNFDPRFIGYWLKSPAFWGYLKGVLGDKSAQPNASASTMTNAPMRVPAALAEQRAIAATLGALDDKIELNRKMNATLEAMARALFRDWFVDFGPTRAKMEGREPYLSPDLWSLFPDRLDAEGKPEGWEISTIGDFIELLDHKRVPLSSQERAKRQGPYPYHGATSVMDHIDSYLFDERLLLLGEDGSVAKEDGRPFTQYVWGKLWVNNHAHVIKGRNMSVEQLKLFFDQIDIRPFVTGAVQPKLNQANLRRVPYLRASDAIHSAFDATIAPLYDLVRQLNEESRTLAQTRDLLLPRLMSGELRVAENKRLVGEVA